MASSSGNTSNNNSWASRIIVGAAFTLLGAQALCMSTMVIQHENRLTRLETTIALELRHLNQTIQERLPP